MNKMRSILCGLGVILLSVSAVSCKDSSKENELNSKTENDSYFKVDDNQSNEKSPKLNAQNNADAIVLAYLNLKNALMEGEIETTKKIARRLIIAFKEFDKKGFSDEEQKELTEILEDAIKESTHISGSKLVHQREHFVSVSEDVLELISIAGTTKTLYQDFCPMYNDGKGAVWLSENKAIKNPYYGAGKMLNCGSIQKVIN